MIEPHLKLLELIPSGVRDYIADVAPSLGTVVSAGWKARARLLQGKGSANRIVFVPSGPFQSIPTVDPGDDEDGSPRELFSLAFRFAVYFWGFESSPATTPGNESDNNDDTGLDMRHVARCLQLFQLTAQALQKNAWGVFDTTSLQWTDVTKEQRHGAELVADLVIRIPVLDAPPLRVSPVAGVPHKGPAPWTEP